MFILSSIDTVLSYQHLLCAVYLSSQYAANAQAQVKVWMGGLFCEL